MRRKSNDKLKIIIILAAALLMFAGAAISALVSNDGYISPSVSKDFSDVSGSKYVSVPESSVPENSVAESSPQVSGTVSDGESGFTVHFIDVGQADSALVICDGKTMLIDGGNAGDSDTLYTYLKKLSVKHLDYVVNTHPHEDHVGGIPGALNYATVGKALASMTEYDTKAFRNFLSSLDKQNVALTVPKPGDTFMLGSAEVTVLGPISYYDDVNNNSIVLRIVYGETSFLFMGDAEREEETEILTSGAVLESTVLKVGHHGSYTSTSYMFLRAIMPEYAIINCGKSNDYNHPHEETLSRLRDAEVRTFRTDLQGDIVCVSDGKTVSFTVKKNPDADTLTK